MKRSTRRNPAIAGALLANPSRRRSRRRSRDASGRFIRRKASARRAARRNPFIGMSRRHPGRVVANVSKRATVTQPHSSRRNIFVIQDHPIQREPRRARRRPVAHAPMQPAPVRGKMHGPRRPRKARKPRAYPKPVVHTGGPSAPPFTTLPSQQRKNPFGVSGALENLLVVATGTALAVLGFKIVPMIAGKLLTLAKQPTTGADGKKTLTADIAQAILAAGGMVAADRFVKNEKYKIAMMTGLGAVLLIPFVKRGLEMAKPGSSANLLGEDPPLRFDFAVTPASIAGALGREADDLYSPEVQRYLRGAAGEELEMPVIQGAAGDELTMPVIQGAAGDELTMPVIQGDPIFGKDNVFGDPIFGKDNVFGENDTDFIPDELLMPVIQ